MEIKSKTQSPIAWVLGQTGDHGKIAEQGTHESLMKQNGIYKDFIGERREAASWKVRNIT